MQRPLPRRLRLHRSLPQRHLHLRQKLQHLRLQSQWLPQQMLWQQLSLLPQRLQLQTRLPQWFRILMCRPPPWRHHLRLLQRHQPAMAWQLRASLSWKQVHCYCRDQSFAIMCAAIDCAVRDVPSVLTVSPVADADILSGSELLHSYGDLSDAQLLHIFGFVDTLNANFTNPHNEVSPIIQAADPSSCRPCPQPLLLAPAVAAMGLTQSVGSLLQVHLPTETLVALCQEQKSGRRLGKNFKRRKDFLRDIDMLPEGFPVTMQDPIPDSLVTVTQVLPVTRFTAPSTHS